MKANFKLVHAAVLTGLCGLTAIALAQPAQGNNPGQTKASDRDGQTSAHFEWLDTNRDGRISRAELDADKQDYLQEGMRSQKIQMADLDTDADGFISRQEWDNRYFDLHGERYRDSFRNGAWKHDASRDHQRDPSKPKQ